MILLGIDLETTGVDTATAEVTEIGAALFDTKYMQIVNMLGALILPDTQKISEGATEVTGITDELVLEHGYSFSRAIQRLNSMMKVADFCVGHNAIAFDAVILRNMYTKYGTIYLDKPWIDTMFDVPYPNRIRARSQIALCAEHGFLNMFPHRALFDVAANFKLLSFYDIDKVVEVASTPLLWVRAKVSFDEKQKAKDRQYMWDGRNKFWVKRMREYYIAEERQDAGFGTMILKESYEFKQTYAE